MALSSNETLCSVQQADDYHTDSFIGEDWLGKEISRKEKLLRAATRKMSTSIVFRGEPTSKDQALPFPRKELKTINGGDVPSDRIPEDVENACAEFALRLDVDTYSDDDVLKDGDILAEGRTRIGRRRIRREIPSEVISMINHYILYVRGQSNIIPRVASWC